MDKNAVRKLWLSRANEQREKIGGRIENGIEQNRKGDTKIKITDKSGNPISLEGVKITQKTHDFKYGANIFMLDEFENERDNITYRENFKKYFNLATVPFYWDGLEPEEGKPRYDKNSKKVYRRPAPDLCMEYCEENGIAAKLHCLVYENFIPDWLPKDDMEKMEKLYEKRISEIAERYGDRRLYEIEVINEILLKHGWPHKSVISSKKDLLEWAFSLARKYLPNDTLVLNEAWTIDALGTMEFFASFYLEAETGILKGASIDKIGMQHHIFTGAVATNDEEYEKAVMSPNLNMVDPEHILRGLDTISNLNRPLELTEVTVPTFGETEEDELLQADLLELLYTVWFSHEKVENVVYWNVPDGFAYNAQGRVWNENQCKGGLWHHDLTPKKSAERLYYLFNKKWHTDLTADTNQKGEISFRGFYGEYEAMIDGKIYPFAVHKNKDNNIEIKI